MDAALLFAELRNAAKKLGLSVRSEPFETPARAGGGLCSLRGERLVLLDARAAPWERIRALARALSELESESVYIAPRARELIEAAREGDRPEAAYAPGGR